MLKDKGSPYSISERRVLELIPVLGSQPAGDVSRAFRCSAPAVWNSLPQTVLSSDSVAVFKLKLKTFLFSQAFSSFSAH